MQSTPSDAWSLERLPPGIAASLFSVRTFAAAMLALYIAFASGLERPAWAMATVYIVSQPIAGAAIAKGFYRIVGTGIGGLFTLLCVPLLVTAPLVLTGVLSLWIATCLYLSLRDRTPRSYVFMLAGYSAAIIGFPNVVAPAGLFGIVVARVEEISLGIICATALSALVFPQTAHAAGLARIRGWLRSADIQAARLFRGSGTRAEVARGERALALEITSLQALMIYLSYEPAASRHTRAIIRAIHGHAVLMLRLLAEIRDRLIVLREEGPLDPDLSKALDRLAGVVERGVHSNPETAALCVREISDEAQRAMQVQQGWHAATLLNLSRRLGEYVDVREDCRTLWRSLEGEQAPSAMSLRVEASAPSPQLGAIDRGNAARAALALVLALWLTGAFWIFTAWPDGATAMMMVAISASVTAAQRQPVPALVEFIAAALIALVFVFVYVFAILPVVEGFFELSVALFPALAVCGFLVANPRTVSLGFGITVTFTTLLGLQNSFGSDLAAFANGNGAAVTGVCVVLACVSLLRPRSAAQAAERLVWHGWEDVAALADVPQAPVRRRIARRLIDRLGLIAPGFAPRRGDDAENAFATLFVAEGVIGLAEIVDDLPVDAGSEIDALMHQIGAYFRGLMAGETPSAAPLLARLEDALRLMADLPAQTGESGASALVSIRRGLIIGTERTDAPSPAPALVEAHP